MINVFMVALTVFLFDANYVHLIQSLILGDMEPDLKDVDLEQEIEIPKHWVLAHQEEG